MKLSHNLIVVGLCTVSLVLGCSDGAILDNGAQGVPPALTLPQGTASTFAGSVATRGAQPGAEIVIKDASGTVIGTALSDQQGNYSLSVDPVVRDNAGPFLVQATLVDGTVLFSLSPGNSIVNVSPLEDGLLRAYYGAFGTSPEEVFANFSLASPVPNPSQFAEALSTLTAPIEQSFGLDPSFEPISTPFDPSANSAYGQMLGSLTVTSNGDLLVLTSRDIEVRARAIPHLGSQGVGFPGVWVTFEGTRTVSGVQTALQTPPVNALVAVSGMVEDVVTAPQAREEIQAAGPIDGTRVLVGYYANWTAYRGYPGQPTGSTDKDAQSRGYNVFQNAGNPSDTTNQIPADKLNVVNYAFARIVDQGETYPYKRGDLEGPPGTVVAFDYWADWGKSYPPDTWADPTRFAPDEFRGNFKEIAKLKAKYPQLKVMISIGGWTLTAPFSDMAKDPKRRALFVRSAVNFMSKYGFDGIDIDWEYPVVRKGTGPDGKDIPGDPADTKNYTALMGELRQALDAKGQNENRKFYLSAAVPAAPKTFAHIELGKVAQSVDWFNLMAYDYHGSFDASPPKTGHLASLFPGTSGSVPDPFGPDDFNTDAAVKAYLAAGVPPQKIIMGVPAYGRSFPQVASIDNNGLFQSFDVSKGNVLGTFDDPKAATGVFDYWHISQLYDSGTDKQFKHYDSTAIAAWTFSGLFKQPDKGSVLITYDDVDNAISKKVDYVKAQLPAPIKGHDLGGIMIWDLAGDVHDATQPNSIVNKVSSRLNN